MRREIDALKKFISLLEQDKVDKTYAFRVVKSLKDAVQRKIYRKFKNYKHLNPKSRSYKKFKKDIIYAKTFCLIGKDDDEISRLYSGIQ